MIKSGYFLERIKLGLAISHIAPASSDPVAQRGLLLFNSRASLEVEVIPTARSMRPRAERPALSC